MKNSLLSETQQGNKNNPSLSHNLPNPCYYLLNKNNTFIISRDRKQTCGCLGLELGRRVGGTDYKEQERIFWGNNNVSFFPSFIEVKWA